MTCHKSHDAVERRDGLPDHADLRIRRRAEVGYSSRRPAIDTLKLCTPGIDCSSLDHGHEHFAKERGVVAAIQDVLGRDRAGGQHVVGVEPLTELVVVPFQPDGHSHLAARQREQRTVGLQRADRALRWWREYRGWR